MMHNYGYMGGGFDFWTLLGHVLIVLLIVWVVMRLIGGPRRWRRWHMRDGYSMWESHSAVSLLNERYAKGEITKEEYEERKKTLMS